MAHRGCGRRPHAAFGGAQANLEKPYRGPRRNPAHLRFLVSIRLARSKAKGLQRVELLSFARTRRTAELRLHDSGHRPDGVLRHTRPVADSRHIGGLMPSFSTYMK